VLRLESDAELVKVVTVHKSKGLEYPLVYLPFAATARKTDRATAASSNTSMKTAAPHRPGAVATKRWRRSTARAWRKTCACSTWR
jgi:ATP-dependent exoDNAse (exonuclease V) beta subunit